MIQRMRVGVALVLLGVVCCVVGLIWGPLRWLVVLSPVLVTVGGVLAFQARGRAGSDRPG